MAALHCISSVLAALDTAAPVSRVSEEAVARVKWFLATTCPAQQVHYSGCNVVTIVPVSPRVQAAALGVLAFVPRVTGGAGAELDLEVVVASLLLLTHADDLAREGAWKILTNVAEV